MEAMISRRGILRGLTCAAAGLGAAVALTACGQKGPLYQPADEKKKKAKVSVRSLRLKNDSAVG